MIAKTQLARLQKRLGYQFNDIQLLVVALTHRSAGHKHNERMEFLGDAVLGSIIARRLFEQFPEADEGQLSRLRSFLVKEKALYELAQQMDLGEYLNLGSGELKSGGFRRASILSDALEAMIGAVYLDSNFATTESIVLALYEQQLAKLSLDMAQKDPKTRLQEWLQGNNLATPDYQVIRSVGKDHAKTYWVECRVAYRSLIAQGEGTSRRKAEQSAAKNILERIENE